jgi:DNA processing protein
VLGTPIDDVFPRSSSSLQAQIARDHLLVSEFPPGSAVSRGNFPRRNRTMALIADVSVIVEADESSGTVSQGWEALRLGRPLFLLKLLVDSGLAWPREMLSYGACVLARPGDLLDVLPSDGLGEAVSF